MGPFTRRGCDSSHGAGPSPEGKKPPHQQQGAGRRLRHGLVAFNHIGMGLRRRSCATAGIQTTRPLQACRSGEQSTAPATTGRYPFAQDTPGILKYGDNDLWLIKMNHRAGCRGVTHIPQPVKELIPGFWNGGQRHLGTRLEVVHACHRSDFTTLDRALFEKKHNVPRSTICRTWCDDDRGGKYYACPQDRSGNPPFHHIPSPAVTKRARAPIRPSAYAPTPQYPY